MQVVANDPHRYNRTFGLLAREGTAMIRPWQAVILVGTAIIVGLVAYWYLAPRETSFGMFDEDGATGNFRFALTFIATLIGVALGSIYRELKDLQAQGIRTIPELKPFFSEVGRSTDLWLGLAGSPIVYGLLLQASNGMSLPGLIVVALQNGFCCLVIVNGFVGKKATPQPETVNAEKP